ncbi:MAG: prephenate dehydratase domain-containing protein [Patescibacteria group bacterium]
MLKPKIYVLGPADSFSDLAVRRFRNAKIAYASSFAVLFKRIQSGSLVLLPVHNKIIGPIPEVKKYLKTHPVKIMKKFRMPISFVLASKRKMSLSEVRRIYSIGPAMDQCKKFLKKYLSSSKKVRVASTAQAYKKIVQLTAQGAAAIGSLAGAKSYQLVVLARQIQDDPKDWTEFVIVKVATPEAE